MIDRTRIAQKLDSGFWRVETVETTGSTNEDLVLRAREGERAGAALIAETQTRGRGRGDHGFFSPGKTGLYLSVVLRESEIASELPTLYAGVCAAEAIETIFPDKRVWIKWVNDLYVEDKKVCGILAQKISLPMAGENKIVLGVGINVCLPRGGFPTDIETTAGALGAEHKPRLRERLAAETLNRLYKGMSREKTEILQAFRARDYLKGKTVTLTESGERATALGIGDDASLILRLTDGSVRRLQSGEVRAVILEKARDLTEDNQKNP